MQLSIFIDLPAQPGGRAGSGGGRGGSSADTTSAGAAPERPAAYMRVDISRITAAGAAGGGGVESFPDRAEQLVATLDGMELPAAAAAAAATAASRPLFPARAAFPSLADSQVRGSHQKRIKPPLPTTPH